jgi:hypothetical protein
MSKQASGHSRDGSSEAFELTRRNRVQRKHQRGHYDKKSVYEILDSGMVCHIAYVVDGQPYCTPTSYWREGNHIYWHGSSASRMLRSQSKGLPVCLTVTHVDATALQQQNEGRCRATSRPGSTRLRTVGNR